MMKRILYCQRSNLALLEVAALRGSWPTLSLADGITLYHPIYDRPLGALLTSYKTTCALHLEQETHATGETIQLCASAIMHALGCIEYKTPSLPALPIALGCAESLCNLASWWSFGTSKRLKFPHYRPCIENSNERWNNLSVWLEDAWQIKRQWEGTKEPDAPAELLDAAIDARAEVLLESIYGKLSIPKVWRWIEVQLEGHYPEGRIETFKSIFKTGLDKPADWHPDDADDLREAIYEHTDHGNEISHFIAARCKAITVAINSVKSEYVLLEDMEPSTTADGIQRWNAPTGAESAMIASLKETSTEREPQRADFPTIGAFIQAQAKYKLALALKGK